MFIESYIIICGNSFEGDLKELLPNREFIEYSVGGLFSKRLEIGISILSQDIIMIGGYDLFLDLRDICKRLAVKGESKGIFYRTDFKFEIYHFRGPTEADLEYCYGEFHEPTNDPISSLWAPDIEMVIHESLRKHEENNVQWWGKNSK